MKGLITFVVLAMFSGASFAEIKVKTLPSYKAAKELSERIMQEVSKDNLEKGIRVMKPYMPISEAEFNAEIAQVAVQQPAINERFGKSIGYDFVSQQVLGDSLVQYAYLQKFERHVMVWRFIFYKPRDVWMLNTFDFNDQVKPLFFAR
ncbi:hypothetical protein [Enterovibrio coralii]|uniref:DUF4864 domain-containing protein n=1 Tax=Enterovibrio coralii TaxID=294935 RepID=A0A135I962_9GAMM|nr:hypothetical protein [Enterovibrio coralii]KXF81948.1 hypothetical protein ATN88_18470 [Enterovibrio coralii]